MPAMEAVLDNDFCRVEEGKEIINDSNPQGQTGELIIDLTPNNDYGFNDSDRNNTPAFDEVVLDHEFGCLEEGKESDMENSVNVTDDGDETSIYIPNANKELDFSDDEDFLLNITHDKNKRASLPQKKETDGR